MRIYSIALLVNLCIVSMKFDSSNWHNGIPGELNDQSNALPSTYLTIIEKCMGDNFPERQFVCKIVSIFKNYAYQLLTYFQFLLFFIKNPRFCIVYHTTTTFSTSSFIIIDNHLALVSIFPNVWFVSGFSGRLIESMLKSMLKFFFFFSREIQHKWWKNDFYGKTIITLFTWWEWIRRALFVVMCLSSPLISRLCHSSLFTFVSEFLENLNKSSRVWIERLQTTAIAHRATDSVDLFCDL